MKKQYFRLVVLLMAIGMGVGNKITPVLSQSDLPIYDIYPQWSPDGSLIAFTSTRAGEFDVWTVRPDGSGLTNLTPEVAEAGILDNSDMLPKWSPNGQRLAFLSTREASLNLDEDTAIDNLLGANDLWIMDADGSNQVNLTVDTPLQILYFNWSPDGQFIAFTSQWVDENNLETVENWIIERDTKALTRVSPVSDGLTLYTTPTWSPDNQSIAFVTTKIASSDSEPIIQNAEIWIIEILSPDDPTILKTDLKTINNLEWSPDGETILVDSESILLANVSTLTISSLADPVDSNGAFGDAKFSSDGSQVVFVYATAEAGNITSDIWVMESSLESEPINLTRSNEIVEVNPTWSPDSSQIAYIALQDEEASLMVMNADGSNPINLTGNATEN